MNKIGLIFLFLAFGSISASAQTFSTGRQPIAFLSTLSGLSESEKSLVHSLDSYLNGKTKSPDFFSQETLRQIQSIKNLRGSYFFLEKPKLAEEQKKTQIRFWVWQREKLVEGYFSLSLDGEEWLLQDLEITSSP